MDEIIYKQHHEWACAPYALKHALLMFNVHEHELKLAKMMKTKYGYGTDYNNFENCIIKLGYKFKFKQVLDNKIAKSVIYDNIKSKPIILCFNNIKYWHAVTILSYRNRKFIVADSATDEVVAEYNWSDLKRRINNNCLLGIFR